MKNKTVNIIGAGLAGTEAAYQLAKRNIKVKLYEVKRITKNPVQVLDGFAELVCSNSLRSNEITNAVGTLKEEMRLLDSLIIRAAEYAQVPAGGSLAVDRVLFSEYITNEISSNKNIEVIDQEVENIDPSEITLIASGPLTTDKLQSEITKIIGSDDFYFYDAVAPIIEKDSIDMSIAYQKNRYDKGETSDYINCPMSKDEYLNFYNELIKAEIAIGHLPGEAELKYFEGCMPVEAMAKRGIETLLFGPMKPRGLDKPDGTRNHAVVQLRQDDANDRLYNIVGFQTNLKWPEQKRIFSMIPGLENAKFVRYGVMHKNNFINSPKVLNRYLQLKSNKNIFFAGQITGVEGYVESCVSGLITAINIANFIEDKEMSIPSSKTVSGALLNYINKASITNFQPMKANWGIVDEIDFKRPSRKVTKQEIKKLKNESFSELAINSIKDYIKNI
ncbi:methylenetetrahydrofolate--tRNA-(uracil(54)-C(5))-methyltransferase (FADH(2)-oxidizing) TrmFO [Mesoplasma entomophilum]|uniref:methylenetetrahydrofolate--tRNA-(uracil(54)- C(5))-methyltransferase (FADH(2)-oxidizing) TrmFO n=1 Tax=Mesoplasma entomophilum TaxID=2149 RepID=UPI000D04039D|nr:methylenetetrahydrofolate--tRNA-(uracil(54)-C(5))-methyltransferase (FADH(2)-oxidizing) TrmFO [Mesoplasma entomophilum]AVN60529.1 methylenetetrahydrofolate--tRNA-(uracil(54)-C(5))-methyltransferase (FADH(2)-oxidizing) TrmFO [Mesoplasma entomophilum]